MATKSFPQATIVNNLPFAVDIYDVFNNTGGGTGKVLLTYTKLATVAAGATSGSIATIRSASQLQAMRTGNITALNNNFYQQFPVAVMVVLVFTAPNKFTLTTDMQQSMEQSFKFIKYVSANPNSQMAKDFSTALGTSPQSDSVNAFFKKTSNFATCTMSTWAAVGNWQAQFLSAWQGTYYLYSASGTSSSSSTTAPVLVATLTIPLDSTASTASTVVMAGSGGQSVTPVMVGDGSMQDSNPGGDNISLSLTPSWLNVAQAGAATQGGQPVTTYVIGALFTGTISGITVAGNLNKLKLPDPTDTSTAAADANKASAFNLNSLSEIGGLLVGIATVYMMAKQNHNAAEQKGNEAASEGTDLADAQKRQAAAEADSEAETMPEFKQAAQNADAQRPSTDAAYDHVAQSEKLVSEVSTINEQVENLGDIIEAEPPTQTLEDAATNIADARADVEAALDPDATDATRTSNIEDASTTLDTTETTIETDMKTDAINNDKAQTKAIEDAEGAITAEQSQEKAAEEATEQQEKEKAQDPSEPLDDGDFGNPEGGEDGEGGGEGGGIHGE